MFVGAGGTSITATASCFSRDRRTDKSSLIAEKSLRHRERSEREAKGPHRSGVGWDDVPHVFFVRISTKSGKAINGGSRDRVLRGAEFQRGNPISEKAVDSAYLRPNK